MTEEEFLHQSQMWREAELAAFRSKKGREPTEAELRLITNRQLRHDRDLTIALAAAAHSRRKERERCLASP